ncbi:Hypothetical predicted protein [Prunus dulcis]|uniref:Uncharacterized protein n=1 Tax=Prunus dulcis TaxID=3755 RepID=A0A5E4G733_PRUDU|nr:Hypothetical predicted protein [Prunus dulcis]
MISWCLFVAEVNRLRGVCRGVVLGMSSRSDMSDSQDMTSNGSAFRDDADALDVVNEMYNVAEQMG